ncbi:hypothetical protein V5D56_18075 [Cellulosimicrobium sp. PMB13]|uniref:metallophosphoesterase family protein n=1 Tax=Cellulosimicrobium sp. PMB13 TaxID=3120158 RepID=UPI003F4BC084
MRTLHRRPRSAPPLVTLVSLALVASLTTAPGAVASAPAAGVAGAVPALTTDRTGDLDLLSDPFLQLPTADGVRVVWFTEFEGTDSVTLVGDGVAALTASQLAVAADGGVPAGVTRVEARTTRLSRVAEDASSQLPPELRPDAADGIVDRTVYRHEAAVTGLEPGVSVPYRVVSAVGGAVAASGTFSLQPQPAPGEGSTILLTSDHQAMVNTPANLQAAAQTLGDIDAVFLAGDLVNIPDRASEWFDDTRGSAFFPSLQGRGGRTSTDGAVYQGGQILQNAPLYPAVGNHEVQGRRAGAKSLGASFNAPVPREVAEAEYAKVAASVNPGDDPAVEARWIEDNSFSTTTYEEIFTLPEDSPGGETYYATTFGDVRLVSLYSTRIWRGTAAQADPAARTSSSRYQEAAANLDDPLAQGYGEHVFEAIDASSEQYAWLSEELQSEEFTNARYRVVILHEGPQGLGDNIMPVFADPVRIEEKDEAGAVVGVRYEYPTSANSLLYDLQPLLEDAGVDLVQNGHSHLWNRFESDNGITHFLETSNTGNTYGAFHALSGRSRPLPGAPWDAANYLAQGNPGGLAPVVPTVNPHRASDGTPLPFVQSNTNAVFTALDTATGEVTSYDLDLAAGGKPRILDRFTIGRPAGDGTGVDLMVSVTAESTPGELVWSVASDAPVDLGVAAPAGDRTAAHGTLHEVSVTDTRQGSPAWYLTGQVGDFRSGSGSTLAASSLGWEPRLLRPGGGTRQGVTVEPDLLAGKGLATPSVLGSAPPGHDQGTAVLGAELSLEAPVEAPTGRYTSTLTLTALG